MYEPHDLEALLAERDWLLERLKSVAHAVSESPLPRREKKRILALCAASEVVREQAPQEAIEPVTAARFLTLIGSAPTWRAGCAACHVGRRLENLWFCSQCGLQY